MFCDMIVREGGERQRLEEVVGWGWGVGMELRKNQEIMRCVHFAYYNNTNIGTVLRAKRLL